MALMKCPKCGGCGETVEQPGLTTTGATLPSTCPSCGGKGYVTDISVESGTTDNTRWVNPIVQREHKRIKRILELILAIWEQFPDMRLGQLLNNAIGEYGANLFYTEDTVAEEKLKKFAGKLGDASINKLLDSL